MHAFMHACRRGQSVEGGGRRERCMRGGEKGAWGQQRQCCGSGWALRRGRLPGRAPKARMCGPPRARARVRGGPSVAPWLGVRACRLMQHEALRACVRACTRQAGQVPHLHACMHTVAPPYTHPCRARKGCPAHAHQHPQRARACPAPGSHGGAPPCSPSLRLPSTLSPLQKLRFVLVPLGFVLEEGCERTVVQQCFSAHT